MSGHGWVRAALLSAIAAISACGGGGGGGTNGGGNALPTLVTTLFSVNEDTELAAQLDAHGDGGGTVTYESVSTPGKGTLTSFAANGAFRYRPAADVNGTDSFVVKMTDSRGGFANATVSIRIDAVPDPVVARSDALRVDAAQLDAIDIVANDSNPDRGQLQLTIETPADVGTASVNANGTVKLSGLPANFRGVTHFSYKVTNAAGASSLANAAIFVGEEPFRVMFVADTSDQGTGGEELFITDMADPAVKLTSASRDGYVLRGYTMSGDGRTVVYRRDLVNTWIPAEFWYFSDLAVPGEHRISFPGGFKPHHEYNEFNSNNQPEQFVASPDGKWIAVVADASDPSVFNKELFLLNVADPAAKLIPVKPASAQWVGTPQFSASSNYLYFEAAGTTYDPALFRIAMAAPTEPAVSLTVRQLTPIPNDPEEYESFGYRLTLDDSNVYIYRSGVAYWRVWLVDTATPGIEHPLFPSPTSLPAGQVVANVNYVDRPPGGPGMSHLFYSSSQWYPVSGTYQYRTYASNLGVTLTPQLVSDSFGVYAVRPDEKAMLGGNGNDYSMYEISLDGSSAPIKINGSGDATDYYYDDSGDTILERRSSEEGYYFHTYIEIAYREESFSRFTRINRANYFCRVLSTAGASRSVVVMSEAPTNNSMSYPAAPLVLVNARAPSLFIPLTAHPAALGMRSNSINFLPGAAKQ